jgi:cholecystokinin-like receptor
MESDNASDWTRGMEFLGYPSSAAPFRNASDVVVQQVANNVSRARGIVVQSSYFYEAGIIQILLYSIIFLLAVVGNALVILTLVQNKRMRTITNLFLLNLAVSDILIGVFCMPFTLVGTLLRDFIFGELMCKLLPFSQGKTSRNAAKVI